MPEAQPGQEQRMERFFIDHGMIHDRVTGKHVDPSPIEYDEGKFDTTPTLETCELLNSLTRPTADLGEDGELDRRLRRTFVENNNEDGCANLGLINPDGPEAADRIELYREALVEARDRFREYEGLHTLKLRDYKGKEPLDYAAGIQYKIDRNREMADKLDAVLSRSGH